MPLRPKSNGEAIMISALQDRIRGFGIPMSNEELKALNQYRQSKGKRSLYRSPGIKYLKLGANLDGYFNKDDFLRQVDEILDCY